MMRVLLFTIVAAGAAQAGSLRTADGRTREWREHAPAATATTATTTTTAAPPGAGMPVMIVLHGGGGDAAGMEERGSFDAEADKRGFLVVYPEGIGRLKFHTWNANAKCCGEALKQNVDDVGFLVALVDELAKERAIDRKRVFLVGHSNGAVMAERALCERPDVFAGAVVVSSPGLAGVCTPKVARPVLVVHGTADKCATFAPAASCGGCFERALSSFLGFDMKASSFSCDGAKAIADRWRAPTSASVDVVTRTVGPAVCTRAKSAQAPVELCTIDGAGHAFPGEKPCKQGRRACEAYLAEVGAPANLDVAALSASFLLDVR